MSSSAWFSLFVICLLGTISPGPSLAAVLKNTLRGSRFHGLVTAIAHAVGVGLYALLVAAGMALVITESPVIFRVITYVGAIYLLCLGYKALTVKAFIVTSSFQETPFLSWKEAALDGFLIAFLNPKLADFFLALFSQFVTPESTLNTKLLMALLVMFCDGVWYVLIAWLAGHNKVLPLLRSKARWVSGVCGIFLIILALKIVLI